MEFLSLPFLALNRTIFERGVAADDPLQMFDVQLKFCDSILNFFQERYVVVIGSEARNLPNV